MITLHQLLYQTKSDCMVKVIIERPATKDTFAGKAIETQSKKEIVGEAKTVFDSLLRTGAEELGYLAEITSVEAGVRGIVTFKWVVITATPKDRLNEYEVFSSNSDTPINARRDIVRAVNFQYAEREAQKVAENHGYKNAWIRLIAGVG